MASTKGGQRLSVSPTWERTGLNACAGIALNQSGTPSAAGTGGSPSSSIGQRNVSVIELSCCEVMSCSKVWMFEACSAERGRCVWNRDGSGRAADLAVDLFEALIVGPTLDPSALYSYQQDE
jgi:hypothetical protein